MFEDPDLAPRHQPKKPKPLDKLSVDELQAGIQELEDEIARYKAEIVKKQAHKEAMASLFKKP